MSITGAIKKYLDGAKDINKLDDTRQKVLLIDNCFFFQNSVFSRRRQPRIRGRTPAEAVAPKAITQATARNKRNDCSDMEW